ncbi:glycosyltransferase [Megalodesulfovibrio paquesii]
MMQKIFLVTPVRNAVATIDEVIWSIVSQTGTHELHYHIQDGGSTDGTLEKIQAWKTRLASLRGLLPTTIRFSYQSAPDKGMYDALVNGFAQLPIGPDDFMGWCNADDGLFPGALDAMARFAEAQPGVDWIIGWWAAFDNLGRLSWLDRLPKYPRAILASGLADGIHWPFVQQESTFWRKRLWDKAGGLDTSLRLAGDWDLWRRFAAHAPLTHIYHQLGGFHVRPGQQSQDMNAYRAEMDRISPRPERLKAFRNCLNTGIPLTSYPWCMESDDRSWMDSVRHCSRKAQWLARLINKMPPHVTLLKHFHKAW